MRCLYWAHLPSILCQDRNAFRDEDKADAAAAEARKAGNAMAKKAYDKMTPEEVRRGKPPQWETTPSHFFHRRLVATRVLA